MNTQLSSAAGRTSIEVVVPETDSGYGSHFHQPAPKEQKRYGWLDTIRGLSCLLVMFLHYFHIGLIALIPIFFSGASEQGHHVIKDTLEFYQNTPYWPFVHTVSDWIFGYWDIAKIGVIGLFLISGYLIPNSIQKYKEYPILSFTLSRVFRLYPVYWISLLLILVFMATGLIQNDGWNTGHIIANFTMFHKYLLIPDLNGVAWTLQMELAFYILCCLMFAFHQIRNQKAVLGMIYGFMGLAVILAIGRYFTGIELPVAFPLRIAMMYIGFLLKMVHDKSYPVEMDLYRKVGLSLIPVLFVICWLAYQPYSWTYFNSYMIGNLMLLAFATYKWEWKPLEHVGRLSYSIYLMHATFGFVLIPMLIKIMPSSLLQQSLLWLLLPMVVSFAVTLGFSTLLLYWVEQPTIAMGKNLIASLPSFISQRKAVFSPRN